MLESLRDKANLLEHPAIAGVIRKAVHIRADLLDQLDGHLAGVAKKLNLATRAELKGLKRNIRELENQVQNLEHQLIHERERAEQAEKALGDAARTAKKATQAEKATQAKDVELTALKAELEAKAQALAKHEADAQAQQAAARRLEEEVAALKAAAEAAPAEKAAPRKNGKKKKADEPTADAETETDEPTPEG